MTPENYKGAEPWPASAPIIDLGFNTSSNILPMAKFSNPAASEFLKLIAEDEPITFQTFDDTKGRHARHLTHVLHGTLQEHLLLLTELNNRGAGIFFTVNATDLKGRESKNITKVRGVFVDLDGAPIQAVLDAPLKPHIIVMSSRNRFHAYWRIEGMSLENFSAVQKALIRRFDGDPSVHDLPRVMRLPGFMHRKGDPILVQMLQHTNELPYSIENFLHAFEIDLAAVESSFSPQLGISHDPILSELNKKGLVRQEIANKKGAWDIICPWNDQHTTGDQGTAYFEPHTNGFKGAGFKCQHAHCAEKGINDLREWLEIGKGDEQIEEWDDPTPLKEDLHPVMLFHEEMLPEALRPWIMDISERMQVPPDFLAAAAVVVIGTLIGRKIGIYPKANDDWLVIPNLRPLHNFSQNL